MKYNKSIIKAIKTAVLSVRTENDILYIKGKHFSCRWNGINFEWTAPSGATYICSAKEVKRYIGDGKYICQYHYSYGNPSNEELWTLMHNGKSYTTTNSY